MTTNLIEAMARAMFTDAGHLGTWDEVVEFDKGYADQWRSRARAALSAIKAAGYVLVLRQHRDMGPGFTHHEGADCPCFAAAPKVSE